MTANTIYSVFQPIPCNGVYKECYSVTIPATEFTKCYSTAIPATEFTL